MLRSRVRVASVRDSLARKAGAPRVASATPALDDEQRSVSAPNGHLLAAKSERVRLPNTSPNFRARALRPFRKRYRKIWISACHPRRSLSQRNRSP